MVQAACNWLCRIAKVLDAWLTGSGPDVHYADLIKNVIFIPCTNFKLLKHASEAGYYIDSTPFIEYDVWTLDIGTTTSFTASHPVTRGFGADSLQSFN